MTDYVESGIYETTELEKIRKILGYEDKGKSNKEFYQMERETMEMAQITVDVYLKNKKKIDKEIAKEKKK